MTDQLLESVQSRYAAVANSTLSNKDAGVRAVAEAVAAASVKVYTVKPGVKATNACCDPTCCS
jgi:hypothetical protein